MKLWLVITLFFVGCARAPLTDPAQAFRPANAPDLRDAYPPESMRTAIERDLRAFDSSKTIPEEFHFAGRVVSRADYRRALEALLPETESLERFQSFVRQNFDFFEVYGGDDWGQVFSTGYYDVTMPGAKKPRGRFTEPLYRTPPDLVSIDLGAYAQRLPDVKPLQDLVLEQKTKSPSWKGRIVKGAGVPKIEPYYERSEIQRERPLAGQGLELAYVDPIDAFFLEIQGSGTVELGNGRKIRVNYDSQNGSAYQPIGKFLFDVIPKEQMSMQRIRQYLASLPRDQQQDVFDRNPSFVFFKETKGEALTYSGAEATGMRTVATDQNLFPKGTLAYFEIEVPVFADATSLEPSAWEFKPRFVLDQDTGGAIRGGGRVDLFTGAGVEAERVAGVMKRAGKMWYLAPKADFLARLPAENGR